VCAIAHIQTTTDRARKRIPHMATATVSKSARRKSEIRSKLSKRPKPATRNRGSVVEVPREQAYLVMAVTEGREEFLTIISWEECSDTAAIKEAAIDWAGSHGHDDEQSWTYNVYPIARIELAGGKIAKAAKGGAA
jgi:hypothetical protein